MNDPRLPPLLSSVELRRLFLAIARTALASSCLSACGQEHVPEELKQPDAGRATSGQLDAAATISREDAASSPSPARDTGVSTSPSDAGTNASVDVGPNGALDAASDGASPDGGSDWQIVPCPQSTALPEAPLQTDPAAAYVGIFSQTFGQCCALPEGGGLPRYHAETARSGTPCPDASATCQQELDQLAKRECASFCRIAVAKVDRGFIRIEQRSELLKLLGSIDSSSEAVLLAAFDSHMVCHGMREDPRDIGSEVHATDGGYELRTTWSKCTPLTRETLSISSGGAIQVNGTETLKPATCAAGRRPPGFCAGGAELGDNPAGAFLAELARLEHASIFAFAQLVRELDALGAPDELKRGALAALRDEVRHAQEMASLARAHGHDVAFAELAQLEARSLLEIAHDNAREGCVRETFGALLATYQAASARDERVREAMTRIAEDETRHAALSWQLMAWITPQLSPSERAALEQTRARAQRELEDELVHTLPERDRLALGLPSPEVARTLLADMSRALLA